VLKKPAAVCAPEPLNAPKLFLPNQAVGDTFTCPLKRCWCGGSLVKWGTIEAQCHDLIGMKDVSHVQMRCCRQTCRTMYGHNYKWEGGQKKNCVKMADLSDGVLFVSAKRCFTLRYLHMFGKLAFRGFLTNRAATWAYDDTFAPDGEDIVGHGADLTVELRKLHADALLYFHTLSQFEIIGMHMDIVVGQEVSDLAVDAYSKFLHKEVFPMPERGSVSVVVGDGHCKVMAKCEGHLPHAGRPRTLQAVKSRNYTNGWFFVLEPGGRILVVQQQVNPENNEDVERAYVRALETHPNVDCIVYDRNCSFAPSRCSNPCFVKVKHWPVDKFHGARHTSKCKYSTQNVPKYARRLKGINTSIAEQTFSWFRNYARTMNEMRPARQKFLILYYVKMHNELVAAGTKEHLGGGSLVPRRHKTGHYACAPKGGLAKASKTLIAAKTKKTITKAKKVMSRCMKKRT
jgi:hypothetical protein